MWAVEGLTHRYPTKVLAELLPTCPQYCGHCTRMDLVGNDTPQVPSTSSRSSSPTARSDPRLPAPHAERARRGRLRRRHGQPADQAAGGVRLGAARHREHPRHPPGHQGPDGPAAALPPGRGAGRRWSAWRARRTTRGVDLAVHTHVNHAQPGHPAGRPRPTQVLLDMGFRDVRNQGVLLRGVNTTPKDLLELCFTLLDHAKIMPYYFYMCDMIPNSEHWRTSVWRGPGAAARDHGLPARLRDAADRVRRAVRRQALGAPGRRATTASRASPYWTKNYRTGIEFDDPEALTRRYQYYDPISTLPEEGRRGGASSSPREWTSSSPGSSRSTLDPKAALLGSERGPHPAPCCPPRSLRWRGIPRPPWTSSKTTSAVARRAFPDVDSDALPRAVPHRGGWRSPPAAPATGNAGSRRRSPDP